MATSPEPNVVSSGDPKRPFQCRRCGSYVTPYQLKCNDCMAPTGVRLGDAEHRRSALGGLPPAPVGPASSEDSGGMRPWLAALVGVLIANGVVVGAYLVLPHERTVIYAPMVAIVLAGFAVGYWTGKVSAGTMAVVLLVTFAIGFKTIVTGSYLLAVVMFVCLGLSFASSWCGARFRLSRERS